MSNEIGLEELAFKVLVGAGAVIMGIIAHYCKGIEKRVERLELGAHDRDTKLAVIETDVKHIRETQNQVVTKLDKLLEHHPK